MKKKKKKQKRTVHSSTKSGNDNDRKQQSSKTANMKSLQNKTNEFIKNLLADLASSSSSSSNSNNSNQGKQKLQMVISVLAPIHCEKPETVELLDSNKELHISSMHLALAESSSILAASRSNHLFKDILYLLFRFHWHMSSIPVIKTYIK